LWLVTGNPIVTESILFGDFSGVLTTGEKDLTSLQIGNTAWTDYVVSVRLHMPFVTNHFLIGVRVKDINNMVALDCRYDRLCGWVIISEGEWEKLPTEKSMLLNPLTITVQGDTFLAVGSYPGFTSGKMSFVLPSKYQGKFTDGGVLIQLTGSMEIDYIDISSIH
jgi:hypothetical protein